MIIVEINGVEYQVNIAPTLNLTVNNTKYPKVVRGDFFVNGQVLDQNGDLVSNVASAQIVTIDTGFSVVINFNDTPVDTATASPYDVYLVNTLGDPIGQEDGITIAIQG